MPKKNKSRKLLIEFENFKIFGDGSNFTLKMYSTDWKYKPSSGEYEPTVKCTGEYSGPSTELSFVSLYSVLAHINEHLFKEMCKVAEEEEIASFTELLELTKLQIAKQEKLLEELGPKMIEFMEPKQSFSSWQANRSNKGKKDVNGRKKNRR